MKTIVADKYLILNSRREVLVFIHEGKEIDDVFLPRMIYGNEEEIIFQQKMMNILNGRVINDENSVYLYEQSKTATRIEEDQSRTKYQRTKRYFACVTDFDDELVGSINEICQEFNIEPFFMPLGYLKHKAWKNIKIPREYRVINIDLDLPKPIKILELKLNYVEY